MLGASNYTYAYATVNETQADWLHGLTGALRFIGGMPEMIVPDCPKALVTNADRYEPVINRTAQDCARHYGTAILPARPRHPKTRRWRRLVCRLWNAGYWPDCDVNASSV